MKTISRLATSMTFGAIALAGIDRSAMAEWTYDTVPGMACKAAGKGTADGIVTSTAGITNVTATPASVLCPVVRTIAVPSIGYRVYVNGQGLLNACRLYSHANTGGVLAVQLMAGSEHKVTSVLAPEHVPGESSQVVQCALVPGGWIYSLEFVQ